MNLLLHMACYSSAKICLGHGHSSGTVARGDRQMFNCFQKWSHQFILPPVTCRHLMDPNPPQLLPLLDF